MKLATRCIPLGSLPYENIDSATRMQAKFFEKMPYLAMLPLLTEEETLLRRTLDKMPGVKIKDRKPVLRTSSNSYKQALLKLDKAFTSPSLENLTPFCIESPFLEKYLQMVKKFKPQNAYVNLLGPFTLSQILQEAAEEQVLTDKSFRKLFIQSICVKALWISEKIREANSETTPLIMLEEPLLGQFGNLKRENEDVTVDLVTNLLAKTIEKMKENNILVGVQCFEKCDWKIPINAGIDLISFDAYNNPNNLCIIPEQIIEFISRGGKINWAIVPAKNESTVKSLKIDEITKRLLLTLDGLVLAGVPANFVYNSALVSVQDDVSKLPIIFAEKAIILSTQLAKRIPVLS